MSKTNFIRDISAEALRKAGYVLLPRLWIKAKDMPEIHKITNRHKHHVNKIRVTAQRKATDPALNQEAAWEAYEKQTSCQNK